MCIYTHKCISWMFLTNVVTFNLVFICTSSLLNCDVTSPQRDANNMVTKLLTVPFVSRHLFHNIRYAMEMKQVMQHKLASVCCLVNMCFIVLHFFSDFSYSFPPFSPSVSVSLSQICRSFTQYQTAMSRNVPHSRKPETV